MTALHSTQVVHLNSFLCLDNHENETETIETNNRLKIQGNMGTVASERRTSFGNHFTSKQNQTEEGKKFSKLSSNEAASKLWDLIHTPNHSSQHINDVSQPKIPSRFTEAQRNHTLYHHSLKQPSSKEELLFLKKNNTSKSILETARETEADLKARLSAALLGAHKHSSTTMTQVPNESRNSFIPSMSLESDCDEYFVGEGQCIETVEESFAMKTFDDGPSPTSTLCFPESSTNYNDEIRSSHSDLYCSIINDQTNQCDEETNYLDQARIPKPSISETFNQRPNNTSELETYSKSHRFVVCADPQLGMATLNRDWEVEIEYCKAAVKKINSLQPRPKFVCVCGDMVDMEPSFYDNPNGLFKWDRSYCERVQEEQVEDFKDIFSEIHPDIALICVCGNHDIGNRPTPETISRFQNDFGDEYLAFWTNGTYNIVLNNVLFNNPDGAMDIFKEQLKWLEDRLKYANKFRAAQIFVYAHHPWFLYNEEEEDPDLIGGNPIPSEWLNDIDDKFKDLVMSDVYFSIPKKQRKIALDLFEQYNVTACFCGHYHQNVVQKTSWGMDMIITGPIGVLLESTWNKDSTEKGRGIRIVDVTLEHSKGCKRKVGGGHFSHYFENF